MGLFDSLFNRKNNKEIKLQQGVNTVQSVIEKTDSQKEATKKAISVAVEEIQAHPEMPVGEFMNRLQQNTDLDDLAITEIIKQLKSEEKIIAAAKGADLSSRQYVDIIKETPISTEAAQIIAEQIPNEAVQKEQQAKLEKILQEEEDQKAREKEQAILGDLAEVYDTCDNIEDPELVRIIDSLHIENKTNNINKQLLKIVAKRTALDCMKYGTPRIPTLTGIIPSIDMFEGDLPILAQNEFKSLKSEYNSNDSDKKIFDYTSDTKKDINTKLLEDMARKSAQAFDKVGDFNIPKTKKFQSLSDEEKNIYAKAVINLSQKGLDEDDEIQLTRELNGEIVSKLKVLNNMFENMKPSERIVAISDCVDFLNSRDKSNQIKSKENNELDESMINIYNKIKNLPYDKQLVAAKAINSALDQQQETIHTSKKSNSTLNQSVSSSNQKESDTSR